MKTLQFENVVLMQYELSLFLPRSPDWYLLLSINDNTYWQTLYYIPIFNGKVT